MTLDPRTLVSVSKYADCHIIPKCFDVSALTVSLDEIVDNRIGTACDSQLQRYLSILIGDNVTGRLSIKGGAQRLSATLNRHTKRFQVRRPPGGTASNFICRALGSDGKHLHWQQFVSETVDCCAAHLSVIHSGFLLMYYLREPDVYCSDFDWVRGLIQRLIDGRTLE